MRKLRAQKKRPKSTELDKEIKEVSPSAVDVKIEAEIRKNLDSIKTFDKNKDGILDDEEINHAVSKAKRWATESEGDEKEWLYFGRDKAVGPLSWKEILEVHKKYPEVFITKDKIDSSDSTKSINWLPAEIVLKVGKILAADQS